MKLQRWNVSGRALTIAAIGIVGLINICPAGAQSGDATITLPARYEYAAKFVCGLAPLSTVKPPSEPAVKPGNYATVINLHNPWNVTVDIQKKVVLAAPETYPQTRLIAPTKRFPDTLPSDFGMSIGCTEIVNLLTQNGTPPTAAFIEGFVVIDSYTAASTAAPAAAQIDVVAVTTTAPGALAGTVSQVNSHEVTVVPGRSLPAGIWPF